MANWYSVEKKEYIKNVFYTIDEESDSYMCPVCECLIPELDNNYIVVYDKYNNKVNNEYIYRHFHKCGNEGFFGYSWDLTDEQKKELNDKRGTTCTPNSMFSK